jgi:hypothetical protein
MDFMADQHVGGRRLRQLTLVDDHSRESLATHLQTASATGQATTKEVHPLLDRQRQPTGDEFVELPIAFFRQGCQGFAAG